MERIPIKIRVPIVFDKQYECPYEKPYGYIYIVTNTTNGHLYVGKHKYNKPSIDHTYTGSGTVLDNAYKKYGDDSFTTEILQWVIGDEIDLNDAEKFWIDAFSTFELPQHYNLTPGGDGYILNEEQRKAMSKRVSGENNPMKNPEISSAFKGKNNYFYGKRYTGSDNYFYGKHFTGSKNSKSKPVVQLSIDGKVIAEYQCIQEASDTTGIDYHRIIECCKGKRKNYGGFCFNYKNKIDSLSDSAKKSIQSLHNIPDLNHRISQGLKSSEKFHKSITEFNKTKRIPVGRFSKSGELLQEYESIKQASLDGYSEPGIQYCLKGKLKTSGGYVWKQLDG